MSPATAAHAPANHCLWKSISAPASTLGSPPVTASGGADRQYSPQLLLTKFPVLLIHCNTCCRLTSPILSVLPLLCLPHPPTLFLDILTSPGTSGCSNYRSKYRRYSDICPRSTAAGTIGPEGAALAQHQPAHISRGDESSEPQSPSTCLSPTCPHLLRYLPHPHPPSPPPQPPSLFLLHLLEPERDGGEVEDTSEVPNLCGSWVRGEQSGPSLLPPPLPRQLCLPLSSLPVRMTLLGPSAHLYPGELNYSCEEHHRLDFE
ncbi:serine/threonine-protein kinase WNK3 isoform X1 [Lates japonicus]|uniref:Serine/threonine-protein kinase WNK3 isoform X1 n=1 Tax=Lates japonicus TaxID=270547 RepID=A0AAD3M1V2_LATJO|nr:serine/threonine-protein kinase WNK3 isoform X1 [Lates japonicus]